MYQIYVKSKNIDIITASVNDIRLGTNNDVVAKITLITIKNIMGNNKE